MNSEHNIQLCIQCALPVVTIMALWQLLNLGTGCTVYIYIYIPGISEKVIQITVKCGRSEINTTKEMSENVVQPGIEPWLNNIFTHFLSCVDF